MTAERRQFIRRDLTPGEGVPATLECAAPGPVRGFLVNASLGGLCVLVPPGAPRLQAGDFVTVRLPGLRLPCRVAHCRTAAPDTLVGVAFEPSPDPERQARRRQSLAAVLGQLFREQAAPQEG
jgi:hypothetical protein